MTGLFDSKSATDDVFRRLATPSNEYALKAKLFAEKMWDRCRDFVDPNAERAMVVDFYPVWWELYLAYALTTTGITLIPHSERLPRQNGFPDLLATNPRVWIEAVMPEPGNGPDALREPIQGTAFDVPADGFVLRLRTALASKVDKIRQYIKAGTIQSDEAVIIALSAGRLPFRFQDYPIPNIVRALYGVGNITVEIDVESRKILNTGADHRDLVVKRSQATVSTDLFLRPENNQISAVLYSSADCANFPPDPGGDFVLVHNPHAKVPIPDDWLGVGDQFWRDGDSIRRSR